MHKRIFLAIDGVILVILGAFAFLSLAGIYIYSPKSFGSLEILVMAGIAALSLLLIFAGISLVRRNRHGGIIAAALFGLGALATLFSSIMNRNMISVAVFFCYAVALVLLISGWKELK